MIVKPALAAMLASGLIVPEKPALILPKPAIVKAENIEFTKHLLLGMPLTMGMLAPKVALPVVEFLGFSSNAANLTTYSFASFNFGTASADRHIIVHVLSSGPILQQRSISSVSIGGVSASLDFTNGTSFYPKGIARANVATGTSGTISVTFSASVDQCIIGVFSIKNISSLVSRDAEFQELTSGTSNSFSVGDGDGTGSFPPSPAVARANDVCLTFGGATANTTHTLSGGSPTPTSHGKSGYVEEIEMSAFSAVLSSGVTQTYTLAFGTGTGNSMLSFIYGPT
jgi:hypothetical protein